MRVIGLTGGIACGKSTVSRMLAQKGYRIIDADLVAREVVKPHSKTLREMRALCGSRTLRKDKTMDRAFIASLVFGTDPVWRQEIDKIMGPPILRKIKRMLVQAGKEGCEVVFLDAALLFETKAEKWCHQVWTVECPLKMQIARGMARNGVTEEQVLARIVTQMSSTRRISLSDRVLFNHGTLEELQERLENCLADMDKQSAATRIAARLWPTKSASKFRGGEAQALLLSRSA